MFRNPENYSIYTMQNEIHTYDQLGSVSITITTSKTNIEKIKDNYQKYLDTYY